MTFNDWNKIGEFCFLKPQDIGKLDLIHENVLTVNIITVWLSIHQIVNKPQRTNNYK